MSEYNGAACLYNHPAGKGRAPETYVADLFVGDWAGLIVTWAPVDGSSRLILSWSDPVDPFGETPPAVSNYNLDVLFGQTAEFYVPNLGQLITVKGVRKAPATTLEFSALVIRGTNVRPPATPHPPSGLLTAANPINVAGASSSSLILPPYTGPAKIWAYTAPGTAAFIDLFSIDWQGASTRLAQVFRGDLASLQGPTELFLPPALIEATFTNPDAGARDFYLTVTPAR